MTTAVAERYLVVYVDLALVHERQVAQPAGNAEPPRLTLDDLPILEVERITVSWISFVTVGTGIAESFADLTAATAGLIHHQSQQSTDR
jgi:hypothetical protein